MGTQEAQQEYGIHLVEDLSNLDAVVFDCHQASTWICPKSSWLFVCVRVSPDGCKISFRACYSATNNLLLSLLMSIKKLHSVAGKLQQSWFWLTCQWGIIVK